MKGGVYIPSQVAHGPSSHVKKWCAAGATGLLFFTLSPPCHRSLPQRNPTTTQGRTLQHLRNNDNNRKWT